MVRIREPFADLFQAAAPASSRVVEPAAEPVGGSAIPVPAEKASVLSTLEVCVVLLLRAIR